MSTINAGYLSNLTTQINAINLEPLKKTLETPVSSSTSTLNAETMKGNLQTITQRMDAISQRFDGVDLSSQKSQISAAMSSLGTGTIPPTLLDSIVGILSGISMDSIKANAKKSTIPSDMAKMSYGNTNATSYYQNLFNELKASNGYNNKVTTEEKNNPDWLYSQLKSGTISMEKYDKDDAKFERISWDTGDSTLVVKVDDTQVAMAKAEYEASMNEITAKDKTYDRELKQIDTEHNAVQTQIDSIGQIINKNIERTFKMFDA